jgi:hypothetical protein
LLWRPLIPGSRDKSGPATLTNGPSLVLPGGANIPTAAGDITVFVADGTTIKCSDYVPAAEQLSLGTQTLTAAQKAQAQSNIFIATTFSAALNAGTATDGVASSLERTPRLRASSGCVCAASATAHVQVFGIIRPHR